MGGLVCTRTNQPSQTPLPHSELRPPRSRSRQEDAEASVAAVRELQESKAKLEDDLQALQRQLAQEREVADRANAAAAAAQRDRHEAELQAAAAAAAAAAVPPASLSPVPASQPAVQPDPQPQRAAQLAQPRAEQVRPSSSDGERTEEDEEEVYREAARSQMQPQSQEQPLTEDGMQALSRQLGQDHDRAFAAAAAQHDPHDLPAAFRGDPHVQEAVVPDEHKEADADAANAAYAAESIILDEVIDSTPATEHDVHEYARWIGMDPQDPEDATLLWIAKEGVDAPLPPEWKPCQSPDGKIYYFNFDTEESVWDHPSDEHYKTLFRNYKRKMSERKPSQQPQTLAVAAEAGARAFLQPLLWPLCATICGFMCSQLWRRFVLCCVRRTEMVEHAGGTPAPRQRPAEMTVTPQSVPHDGSLADNAAKSLDYGVHDDDSGESSGFESDFGSDAVVDVQEQTGITNAPHDETQASVRCLSALPLSATLNQLETLETVQVGEIFGVLEMSRDQSGLQMARTPHGWLPMLDETGTSLVVEMHGPHEAWLDVAGYTDFVEWVNQTNAAKADSDAAARSAAVLQSSITTMINGAHASRTLA